MEHPDSLYRMIKKILPSKVHKQYRDIRRRNTGNSGSLTNSTRSIFQQFLPALNRKTRNLIEVISFRKSQFF